MNLKNLSIQIRPRTNWEAFDLGRSLLAQNFKIVYLPWIVVNLILIAVLLPVCFYSSTLALVLYIFLIPVGERVITLVISRAVFGEKLTLGKTLKMWLPQAKPGLFSYYCLYRFLPSRSLLVPVWQLENLKGKQLFSRLKTLSYNCGNAIFGAGLFFLCLESMLCYGMITFVVSLIPEGVVDWKEFGLDLVVFGFPPSIIAIFAISYIIAVIILRPLYVVGGFTLYLHRRMVLEGWDIELQFRSLASRLSGGLLIPMLVMGSYFGATDLQGEETPKQRIERILDSQDFKREKVVEGRRPKGNTQLKEEGESKIRAEIFEVVALLIKYLFIFLIIGLIGWLVWHIFKTLQKNKIISPKTAETPVPIIKVMGMNISRETIPDDVAGEAEKLILAGDLRGGLALLYRASLFKIIENYRVVLGSGFTENDCLRAVKTVLPKEDEVYFKKLTNRWLLSAYAHIFPEEKEALSFCSEWKSHFSAPRVEVKP